MHGLRAVLAVFERRRDDLLRVAYAPSVRPFVADLARWAAPRGIPCVEFPEGELDRVAATSHHEGLCAVTRPRAWLSLDDLGARLAGSRGVALALDRVRNPYNAGAILRTAAFFGVDAVLLGAPAPDPGLAATAVRVAEGGAEHVDLARTTDLAATLSRLRTRGITVVGADSHAGEDALAFSFPPPCVLVVGHEREGLSERVRAQCDAMVAVRGRGALDSLNVAVATGVLVARMTTARTR